MKRNEIGGACWNQHCVSLHVYIDLALDQILWVMLHRFKCLQSIHLFYFLLFACVADFSSLKTNFKLILLFVVELQLVLFSFLDIWLLLLLIGGFRTQTGRLDYWVSSSAFNNNLLIFVHIVVLLLVFSFWLWLGCGFCLLSWLLNRFRIWIFKLVADVSIFPSDFFCYHQSWLTLLLYNNSISNSYNRSLSIFVNFIKTNSNVQSHARLKDCLICFI